VFILVSTISAFFDQVSKGLAVIFLPGSGSVHVLREYFQFTLIRNRGAAFGISLGPNSDLLLLFISIAAILLIVYYYFRTAPDKMWQHLSFGMITGGAIGNLIDRIAKGEVVDFIDCGIGGLRWPIFNVADIAVTAGALLFLFYSLGHAEQGRSNLPSPD